MSAGISRREFARREGCNDKVIRRGIESGHLQPFPDGTLDPAAVGTDWRRANRDAADVSAAAVRTVRTEPQRGAEEEDLSELIDADQFVAGVMAGRIYKVADSERVKEGALAAKQVMAARQAAGDLIEFRVAEAAFFEAARAARDSWTNWPSRVGPLAAADLGLPADQVTEVLTAHVQAHLAELGEPEPSFTVLPD